jgi:integrase
MVASSLKPSINAQLISRGSRPSRFADLIPALRLCKLKPQLERTLALPISVPGLHISECLGLQWEDIDWEKQEIFVCRAWTRGKIGRPKSRASKAPVSASCASRHLSAGMEKQHAGYSKPEDWGFASERLDGKQPRVPNLPVADHLRPELLGGQKVSVGFRSLRHSLASFLVDSGTDPKTVQDLLRQGDVQITLEFYAHSKHATKLAAQGQMLEAILQRPVAEAIMRRQ